MKKHNFKLIKVNMFVYTFKCVDCYMTITPYIDRVRSALTSDPYKSIFDFPNRLMGCEEYYWWRRSYFEPHGVFTIHTDGKLVWNRR